ncbi:MAG TPA: CHAP domain-containing protein [Pseudonocardiaceae bacterium]
MDTREIARQFAGRMIAHRNKLAGKTEDALLVQFALHQAAEAIGQQQADHKQAATTALSHWDGTTSDRFERRSDRLGRQLRVTGEASRAGEGIVADTTAALSAGHANASRIVEEYVTRASQALDAGLAASGAGAPAALAQAIATASDLEKQYTRESITNLRTVHTQLKEAAQRLRALEREIEHDGVVDPNRRRNRPEGGRGDGGRGDGKGGNRPERVRKILSEARGEIGTRENPPGSNRNPYGPTAAWCSSFATAMWRRAGVDIPILPFTGDVYEWGQEHGKAYGRNNLDEVRPGDVLLFGTGPSSPSTSTHIGIVEKVENGMVTLIEGNSGDQVQRNTHRLSGATFYGGVHP